MSRQPMFKNRDFLFLLLGGLASAYISNLATRSYIHQKYLNDRIAENVFATGSLIQTLDHLDQGDYLEVKSRLEKSLAQRYLLAETHASDKGPTGDLARATLARIAPHRSNPLYMQQESDLRELYKSSGKKQ